MFGSITTWVADVSQAVGGVAMAGNVATIIMVVLAAALLLSAAAIVGEALQDWVTTRRRKRSTHRRSRHAARVGRLLTSHRRG